MGSLALNDAGQFPALFQGTETRRRDPYLNEAIEALNLHLLAFDPGPDQVPTAFNNLGKSESEFVDEEIEKCANDARYYLENYHVIKPEDDAPHTLYPFWDSQEIFYAEIVSMQAAGKQVKVIILKARQLGISTLTQGLIFHKTIFTEATNTLIMAQDPGQADYLFNMSRTAYDYMPWWMKPEVRYAAKGRYMTFDRNDEFERSFHPGLKSEIFVEAANKTTGVAVGKSLRAVHLSELSDWKSDPKILTTQIFPTMNAKDLLAVMESTARGKDNFWYDFWCDCIEGRQQWRPVFIPYFFVKKYSLPIEAGNTFKATDEEDAIRKKVLKRLKFYIPDETFNWRRAKLAEVIGLHGDESYFFQEYPGTNWQESFQGSGICAFPKRKLQIIRETLTATPAWVGEIEYKGDVRERVRLLPCTECDWVDNNTVAGDSYIPPQTTYGGRLHIWEFPDHGERYYIGGDVAHGLEKKGADFSCAQVIKIGRGQEPDVQVAEWHGWILPSQFAYVLAALGYYYNQSEIAPEVNDVGQQTFNEMFRVIEYPDIFRWKHYDKVKHFITDTFGWWTNSKTRDLIITKTREFVMQEKLVLRSDELIDQMLDFGQADGDSRFEGQSTHDDRVFALMIAVWCAHYSDYGAEAAMSARPPDSPSQRLFYVFDSTNRLVLRTEHRDEAEAQVRGYIDPEGKYRLRAGYYMMQTASRRDFSNSDYSPVHDRPGPRNTMHTELNIPAEMISLDNMIVKPRQDGDDDWRNF